MRIICLCLVILSIASVGAAQTPIPCWPIQLRVYIAYGIQPCLHPHLLQHEVQEWQGVWPDIPACDQPTDAQIAAWRLIRWTWINPLKEELRACLELHGPVE
jgi:hypothetical protein